LYKFTFAAIYGSVNLPPWKMKFTPEVNIPQVENYWLSASAQFAHVRSVNPLACRGRKLASGLLCSWSL